MKELQKYGFLRFVCVLENHRDRTIDTLNQRTVPCTSQKIWSIQKKAVTLRRESTKQILL